MSRLVDESARRLEEQLRAERRERGASEATLLKLLEATCLKVAAAQAL
jgi:hypothetical protein